MKKETIIFGGGPAGLTAAYNLTKNGYHAVVLEKDDEYVGGISRTAKYNGYFFDIGGHRFFSKSQEIEDLWTEILKDELIVRNRLSRIYYKNKFYYYPLKAFNALFNLGIFSSFTAFLSYLKAKMFPIKEPKSFEDWVTNQFGKKLYSIFFKTYTEKVWGITCSEISADWAAQRIKGLSLASAIKSALFPKGLFRKNGKVIKTLIDKFRYPKRGPGQLWEKCASLIEKQNGSVKMDSKVFKLEHQNDQITRAHYRTKNGDEAIDGDEFISTLPIRELVNSLDPKPPENVVKAANSLGYRDFLTVVLIIDNPHLFDDNWIYIHDPSVVMGRIQNFKNWSPFMVPDETKTCLGLEYFCFEGDGLWEASNEELVKLGTKEIDLLGLAKKEEVIDGTVVRMQKAYPIYDEYYKDHLDVILKYLDKFTNLQLIGRNGMHKYNNQDHAMMTGLLATKNIMEGSRKYNVWNVNVDAQYHEEVSEDEDSFDYGDLKK